MKYLTRKKVYVKEEPSKDAKKLYIFCEGIKEVDYLRYFQGFSSNIDIIPIPNENGKSDPVKLKEQSERQLENGNLSISEELKDEIWFVIDTDKWSEEGKITELKEYIAQKNRQYSGWRIAQSNPLFELWLYYHFKSTKPIKEEVNRYPHFKAYVDAKIGGGFDNRKMPIEIQKAATHAKNNFEEENDEPKYLSTEMYILAETIISFTKKQLDKALLNTKEDSLNS